MHANNCMAKNPFDRRLSTHTRTKTKPKETNEGVNPVSLNRFSIPTRIRPLKRKGLAGVSTHAAQNTTLPARPHFSGLTKNLQNHLLLSPNAFHQLLSTASTPYVGKLPKVFCQAAPHNPKIVYQALDELAPLLRSLPKGGQVHLCLGEGKVPITLEYKGTGIRGKLYQLTLNQKHFALKVYHRTNLVGFHGAYGEIAAGLYFSKRQMKDIAQFHFGNPTAGWGVFEFIPPDMKASQRSGKSIREYPVSLWDDVASNYINGIRIDYGGITRAGCEDPDDDIEGMQSIGTTPSRQEALSLITFDNYKRAMASCDPERQIATLDALTFLSGSPGEKLQIFQLGMAAQSLKVRAAAAFAIRDLPEEVQKNAWLLAMQSKEEEVRIEAACTISRLPENFQKEAYIMAMNTQNPKVQRQASTQIDSIPRDYRKEAFLLAFNTRLPEVQAGAAGKINSLPVEFRAEAYKMSLNTGISEVQTAAASQIDTLPPESQPDLYRQTHALQDTKCRKALIERINKLSEAVQKEAYRLALDTKDATQAPTQDHGQDLEIQKIAIQNFRFLPMDFREEAYRLAITLKNPTLQTCAAKTIPDCPPQFQREAYRLAMKTGVLEVQAAAASKIRKLSEPLRKEAFLLALNTQAPIVQTSALQSVEMNDYGESVDKVQDDLLPEYIRHKEKQHPFTHVSQVSLQYPGLAL